MKLIKNLASACALGGLLFTFSCNNAEEKKGDEPSVKSDTAKPAPPAKPFNVVTIMHKVKDFAKWLPGYEGHDSVRLKYGLHNYVIGRGVDDTNMVFIALRMDDVAKAKEFAALPDLKAAMEKGGVIGKPEIHFMDMQRMDTSRSTNPLRMRVSHKVKDYDAWLKAFDEGKQARVDAGLTDRALGYEVDNKNWVSIVNMAGDLKKAKDFGASKELKDKMMAAGVDGPPTIFFYNMVKRY